MYLSQIPGYTRACERGDRLEDYWRDFAFLGLDEELRIAGGGKIAVRLLTLRMFIQLCAVRSPFLVGGRVGPEHVAQILWRLSPQYDCRATAPVAGAGDSPRRSPSTAEAGAPALQTPRQQFVASIAHLPFPATTRAVARYLDRMLIDKPPQTSRPSGTKSDTSFAASMVHALAKEYGWSVDTILDLPMPRLFQYLRKIQRSQDPELSYFNPLRDRFAKRITDKYLNRKKP